MAPGWLVSLLLTTSPEVGAPAPDFNAQDTSGKQVKLTELLREGPVIVAFFPKAFTLG
jgi:thioredoxin-dependent peroxiredoxin